MTPPETIANSAIGLINIVGLVSNYIYARRNGLGAAQKDLVATLQDLSAVKEELRAECEKERKEQTREIDQLKSAFVDTAVAFSMALKNEHQRASLVRDLEAKVMGVDRRHPVEG